MDLLLEYSKLFTGALLNPAGCVVGLLLGLLALRWWQYSLAAAATFIASCVYVAAVYSLRWPEPLTILAHVPSAMIWAWFGMVGRRLIHSMRSDPAGAP